MQEAELIQYIEQKVLQKVIIDAYRNIHPMYLNKFSYQNLSYLEH